MWTEPNPKASCERHWLFSQLLEKGEGGKSKTRKLPATHPHQHRGQRAFRGQRSEAPEGWGSQDRHISAAEIDQSELSVSQGVQGKVPSCEMTSFILSVYRGDGEIGLPGPRPLTAPEQSLVKEASAAWVPKTGISLSSFSSELLGTGLLSSFTGQRQLQG